MSETNIRKEFVMPIAVLTIICLVMAALLAFTNGVTDPIIKKAEQQAAQQARLEVLPQAANFERVDIDPAELPSSVTDVYKATNDTGYAVSLDGDGYGGKKTLKMIVGVDENGFITDTKVMSHSETPGWDPESRNRTSKTSSTDWMKAASTGSSPFPARRSPPTTTSTP